jgi:hypothetical protein
VTPSTAARPFCSEAARDRGETLGGTASRIDTWLLVEYAGYWPYEPLHAAAFAGPLREQLAAQLAAHRPARLLLVKRSGHRSDGSIEVVYGRTAEQGGRFRRLELGSYDELGRLDLSGRAGVLLRHPLLLACTHGIRDRCCARYGHSLHRELLRQADPEWVRQASHVGGDRFAGNLVVLPEGLYFGRVGRNEVAPLLSSYAAGRIELGTYRGRSCYPFPVQAAEGHVRRATGLAGIDDLRLVQVRREARDRYVVQLEAVPTATLHELEVAAELGEPVLLTCKAEEPRPPRRFVVRSHRQRESV